MKLFLLQQEENTSWDTYDSIVVCAIDEEDAKTIDPYGDVFIPVKYLGTWAKTKEGIICTEIGQASIDLKRGVVIGSFNAG
jgi:hypothetical protein